MRGDWRDGRHAPRADLKSGCGFLDFSMDIELPEATIV
jgi:hypothetical protein